MASGARVEIDIASKRFSNMAEPVLEGLKLTVEPSTTLALIGPSGAGKSTLLRLIAGIDRDFDGQVMVNGKAAHVAETPGFVFQDPRLLPWLTAEDNIRAVRADITRDAAVELLHEVGLKGFESALPHQLSGGMQRRVALARALALSPRVLLLDEPFVSLDRKLARELHKVFLKVIKSYRPTVILVSHDIEDVAQLADRIVLLSGQPAQVKSELVVPGKAGDRDVAAIAGISDALSDAEETVD